jgi:hypothetical protein
MDRYKYAEAILYGSFGEMPGKTVFPEKRSYYYGTEGVRFFKRVLDTDTISSREFRNFDSTYYLLLG